MNPSGSALEFRIVGGLTDEQEAHCPDFCTFAALEPEAADMSRVLDGFANRSLEFHGIPAGIALVASIDKYLLQVQERLSI
jgi:hypothetical protein